MLGEDLEGLLDFMLVIGDLLTPALWHGGHLAAQSKIPRVLLNSCISAACQQVLPGPPPARPTTKTEPDLLLSPPARPQTAPVALTSLPLTPRSAASGTVPWHCAAYNPSEHRAHLSLQGPLSPDLSSFPPLSLYLLSLRLGLFRHIGLLFALKCASQPLRLLSPLPWRFLLRLTTSPLSGHSPDVIFLEMPSLVSLVTTQWLFMKWPCFYRMYCHLAICVYLLTLSL